MDSSSLRAREGSRWRSPPRTVGAAPCGTTPATPRSPPRLGLSVPPVPAFNTESGGTVCLDRGGKHLQPWRLRLVLADGSGGGGHHYVAGPGPSPPPPGSGVDPLTFSPPLRLPVLRIPGGSGGKGEAPSRWRRGRAGATASNDGACEERGGARPLGGVVKAGNPKLDPDRPRKRLEQLSSEFEATWRPPPAASSMTTSGTSPGPGGGGGGEGDRDLTSRQDGGGDLAPANDDPRRPPAGACGDSTWTWTWIGTGVLGRGGKKR